MKVLHIVGSINKSAGGPSRSVPQTCEQLSDLGVNVELITRPGRDIVSVRTSDRLKLTFFTFCQLIKLGSQLVDKKISIIHLQHVWDPYLHIMAWIARRKGIPYIITPRGMLEPWIMAQRPWKKKLGMFLYQRKDIEQAASLHATCEMEKKHIQALGFTNNIEVIPNGIDVENIQIKSSWKPTRKLLFLSRIHVKKGIELLIEAVAKLKNQLQDVQVIIAGEGDTDYINALKVKAEQLGVSTIIQFIGSAYGNQKWELFQQADIFILPTYSENFGIVVAEALASGTPVITTTGTPWEELNTERCGWCIDLSVENLVKTITEAIQKDASELKEMGLRGRKLVEEKYDIKAVAKQMVELYESFLL